MIKSTPLSSVDISDLKGQSVLITGGASGLGRNTAKAFAETGAYVTIADVQPADEFINELSTSGHHAQIVHCDVTDWNSQVAAFKKAMQFSPTGTIDVVAVFAAVDKAGHIIDQVNGTAPTSYDDPTPPSTLAFDVNLKGCFYSTYLALHYFRSSPKNDRDTTRAKALVIVGSLAGYIDDTHNSSYTASKFGVRGIFRAVRQRAHAELGVRCNLIAPWAIRTPMTEPLLAMMGKFGIEEGKGITMAKSETVVDAVGRCAVDNTFIGRAIAVMPEGPFDIGDDIEGGYGGDELRKLMAMRKADGDFLTG